MAVPLFKMLTIGILPVPLKNYYYRMKGATIGKGVSIGLFSIIDCPNININDNVRIGAFSFISCKKLNLGKRVKINMMVAIDTGEVSIDNDSVIMEQVVVGGMLTPRSKLTIGKRVKIFPYSFLNPTEEIIIEDDVGIGGANYIFTHGSWQSILDGFPVGFGPVTIKKGVWFPWRVFVMPNVIVGEFATIGAGSVITKNIPDRSLAAGVPAKVLKQGNEYINEYTREEKISIVNNILQEYSAFLNYKYNTNKSIITEVSNGIDLTYIDNRVISFRNKFEITIYSNVLIIFDNINEIELKYINESTILWFDIEGKKTFYSEDIIWIETKEFFSRYGIRFEIDS